MVAYICRTTGYTIAKRHIGHGSTQERLRLGGKFPRFTRLQAASMDHVYMLSEVSRKKVNIWRVLWNSIWTLEPGLDAPTTKVRPAVGALLWLRIRTISICLVVLETHSITISGDSIHPTTEMEPQLRDSTRLTPQTVRFIFSYEHFSIKTTIFHLEFLQMLNKFFSNRNSYSI